MSRARASASARVQLAAPPARAFPPIGDYGAIGDCGSLALVSREGSIDWLCWPCFDSPSLFARLLDRERGGHFELRPAVAFETTRRYLPGTNVLETTFTCEGGAVQLVDFMVALHPSEEPAALSPQRQLVRRVTGLEGEVPLRVELAVRPDYARRAVRLEDRGPLGLLAELHRGALVVRSEVPLRPAPEARWVGELVLRAGERRTLALAYDAAAPAVLPALGSRAEALLEGTVRFWRGWAERCCYQGRYRAAVERSALALKLLSYAPSGAVVAAPTASLPERLGGARNWDYRYCWLRDAAFAVRALFELGYPDEGASFYAWVIHATRRTFPRLQVVYDVYGRHCPAERVLAHLEGYAGSRPVRIGNGARTQLQLDTHGILVASAREHMQHQGPPDLVQRWMLRRVGDRVCQEWRCPDSGIWEVRSAPVRHTLSAVMCWVALERLLGLVEAGALTARAAPRWRRERDAIRAEVEARGFDRRLGSYVSVLGGRDVDASLLLLGLYGYVAPDDPRMLGTARRIREVLGEGPLLRRYPTEWDDGVGGPEGAFGACCFWEVELLARAGLRAEAHERMQALLELATDLGLYAEELDPPSGAALGNFPQAFTHLALISAAVRLEACDRVGSARGVGE